MVNYAKSIIYKLCCKNPSITDEYIGSTTNKDRRKHQHKNCCNNENIEKNNLPVYRCIRANGGFENWDMIVLEEYPCESKRELEMRERYWFELINPTLNKFIPRRTDEEIKELEKKYNKSDACKESKRKYMKSDAGKESNRKFNKSDAKKEANRKYRIKRKIINQSAIVIQKFFRKYVKREV